MSPEPVKAQQPGPAPPNKAAPQRPQPPPEFRAEHLLSLTAAELTALLENPDATLFQRAKACQRLAVIGGKEAVPALAALLADPNLSHYARFGLEPNPDPAAAAALRAALRKVKGPLLVGIINSIGARRDPEAVEALGRLLAHADPEVARAAAAALGRIGGVRGARLLEDGLRRYRGSVREAVAAAMLACAERLIELGERERGLALYRSLMRPDIPKAVRLGAMHSAFLAETPAARVR